VKIRTGQAKKLPTFSVQMKVAGCVYISNKTHIYRQFLHFPYRYWLSKKIIRRNFLAGILDLIDISMI
jgi:hypothetical protein